MDIKLQLKALLQEAEIYQSQGLINEADAKFEQAANLINSVDRLKNKENLLKAIGQKRDALGVTRNKVDEDTGSPELSKKAQDLIKNLFTFTENKDSDAASLEGAITLAKFGQFDRALLEFNALLEKDGVRVEAAKNILRCYLSSSTSEDAVNQYHQWYAHL